MSRGPPLELPTSVPTPAQNLRSQSGSGPSDAALVVAARAGEAWAQEALFRRYTRMVTGLAYRLLGRDDGELEDLVQDAFMQALTKLDTLSEPGSFSSWLGSIVVRAACVRLRRRRLMERLGLRRRDPIDFEALPFERVAPPDIAVELKRIYARLEDLPAEMRVAVVLRLVEGLELTEVAERMGISLATVKRRLQAAYERLGVRNEAGGL